MAFNIPKYPAEEYYYYGPTDEYIIRDHTGNERRIPAAQMKDYIPPWANVAQSINKVPFPVKNVSPLASVIENETYRARLVQMRLRLREGETMPYQYFATAHAGDKVFVFVVQDNQAVTLEDGATMFPSDQLITQLRLLEK